MLASFVVACTTTQPIDLGTSSALTEEVHPGDKVVVTTHDGRELSFEVVRVEDDELVGATERVAREDIAQLEVKRLSPLRTAGLAGAGLLAAGIIAGVVLFFVALSSFAAPA